MSIPHQNASICFEIKGEDGMIVNLLIDNELGKNNKFISITSFEQVVEQESG